MLTRDAEKVRGKTGVADALTVVYGLKRLFRSSIRANKEGGHDRGTRTVTPLDLLGGDFVTELRTGRFQGIDALYMNFRLAWMLYSFAKIEFKLIFWKSDHLQRSLPADCNCC
jgi:hypothetical protein